MTNRIDRRSLLRLGGAAVAACSFRVPNAFAQDDPKVILRLAADRMAALVSFHFEMQTIDGKSTILDNLELNKVVGDVVRPDSFQAVITARLAIIDVSVGVVSIGGRVWVTDPLKAGQVWQQIANGEEADSSASSFTDLINPDRLFLAAVTYIEDPVIEGTEQVNGEDCTVITGTFVPARLQELASPTAAETEVLDPASLLSSDPVYLTAWIAADGRVFRMEEEGPITASESSDVIREIVITDFDADIQIVEPTVAE